MKIYATSDLHGQLPDPSWVPPCDIFIVAGDVTPFHNHGMDFQAYWIRCHFVPFMASVRAKHKVWIAGNHDFVCRKPDLVRSQHCHYLQDEEITLDGIRIYGTPWTPVFGHWAFMAKDAALEEGYAKIPQGIDILISHGPPRGYCDRNVQGLHCGSDALLRRVIETQPQAVVCGNIHEGYGLRTVNGTDIYNVSRVNFSYQPVNPIVEIVLR